MPRAYLAHLLPHSPTPSLPETFPEYSDFHILAPLHCKIKVDDGMTWFKDEIFFVWVLLQPSLRRPITEIRSRYGGGLTICALIAPLIIIASPLIFALIICFDDSPIIALSSSYRRLLYCNLWLLIVRDLSSWPEVAFFNILFSKIINHCEHKCRKSIFHGACLSRRVVSRDGEPLLLKLSGYERHKHQANPYNPVKHGND